jgi:hypothetical protein
MTIVALSAYAEFACGQSSGGTTASSDTHGMTTLPVNRRLIDSFGGGYYDAVQPGTAASSYLNGMAAFAKGLGAFSYDSALASGYYEDAKRKGVDNQLHAEQTYFEMRRVNDEYWLSKHQPMTPEQQAQIDQSRLPRRLTTSELDPTWGVIRWPAVLERTKFDTVRSQLNDIFAHRGDESFGVGTPIYAQIQQLARDMRSQLDKDYPTMSQVEWIQAMRFIESLAYEARFAPGVVVGMNVR